MSFKRAEKVWHRSFNRPLLSLRDAAWSRHEATRSSFTCDSPWRWQITQNNWAARSYGPYSSCVACEVKIKYRTSLNLILRKGTLFYNEDMQTVEASAPFSSSKIDVLKCRSKNPAKSPRLFSCLVAHVSRKETKIMKLSCLSSVKAGDSCHFHVMFF